MHSLLPTRADVLVVGAGPAGLAAAWEASLADRSVCVLERDSVVGGLCATVERDGFRFDLGGHRIVSKRSSLVARIRDLLGDSLEERTRHSVISLDGARFTYPLRASELLAQLPRAELARAAADYLCEGARDAAGLGRDDSTFEGWVTRRFGRALYDRFFGPYTAKLWGIDPRRLSADWASQRISLANLADVGLRLAGLRRGGARTYARRYLYPTGGIGVLFERLTAHLRARGVTIVTGADVRGFERDARTGAVRSVRVRARDDEERAIACDAVLSTAPLAQLASWVAPDEPRVAAASSRLRHRGLRFVHLMLEGAGPVLGATWMYVPDPSLVMTRVQEPAERSRAMVPDGCASLMCEVPADPGDPLWSLSDEDLAARCVEDLARLGVDVRARVRGYFSTRSAHAYPVYELGYRRARDELYAHVARAPNAWSVGRQGLFRYVFMDTAMEMGFAAARSFLRGERADLRAIERIDEGPALHEGFARTR